MVEWFLGSVLRGSRLGAAGVLLILMAAVATTPGVALAESELGKEKFKAGDKAPDFAAQDLAGQQVKLSAYAGKSVVLLNFWGLRCGACLEEMPYLEALAKSYGAKGLVVLGVDTDGVNATEVRNTLKEVGVAVSYPLLVDPDFAVTDVYTNFLVPLTLVIDKGGTIQYIHTGFEKGTEKNYESAVKKALGL